MNEKIYGIQLIRVIACLMIVFHHMTDAFGIHLVNSLGRCAVTIFIVIAGFLAGYLGGGRAKAV